PAPRPGAPHPLLSFPTRRSSDLRSAEISASARGSDAFGTASSSQSLFLRTAPPAAPRAWTDSGRILPQLIGAGLATPRARRPRADRKSTRLNSSHVKISYAVFCL